MASRRRNGWRRFAVGVFIAVVGAAGALGLGSSRLGRILELKTYDLAMTLRGARSDSGVVIVAVDDKSRARLREPLLFWQAYYAKVFRALARAGARAVGVDIVFGLPVERWAPGADRQLAQAYLEAVAAGTPIVLGFDRSVSPPELPVYLFASAYKLLGFLNLTPDEDDFIRRQELCAKTAGGEVYSLGLQLAAQALRQPIRREGGRLFLGPRLLPQDPKGALLIDYRGPTHTLRYVSFVDVLDAVDSGREDLLKQRFAGKVVLLGSEDWQDRHSTPFYLSGARTQRTPGVEIHGSTIVTLLNAQEIQPVSPRTSLLLLLLLTASATGLSFRLRWPVALAAIGGLIAGLTAASLWFLWRQIWLPLWTPLLAMPLSYTAVFVYRYRAEYRAHRQLRQQFGQYVSDAVVQEILEQGEIPLEGKRQKITVLISDVRDFTTLSERSSPEVLVAHINEYLSAMTEVIMEEGGLVDKFMGDGILALFGAPVEHSDDAWRAVRVGLRMLECLEELNHRWTSCGRPTLRIGIGIHTGLAVVGNIGSTRKMEYTALGDTVNVAARVEGMTKKYKAPLLVTEATLAELAGRRIQVQEAGVEQLKGKTETTRLYIVQQLRDA